jgi:NADH-quinone oxidoreductase subunit M
MNPLYLFVSPLVASAFALILGKNGVLQRILSILVLVGTLGMLFYWKQMEIAESSFSYPWIESFGVYLALSINSLNFWFLALASIVVFAAQLYHSSQDESQIRPDVLAMVYSLLFFLNGVFMAQDLMLFYFCYEASILPIYFISSRYGSPAAERATLKFFIYTLFGSLFMLLAILYMYNETGAQNFLMSSFNGQTFSSPVQGYLFLAFFIAFAIKMPLFPFHSWQADVYAESPVESTILMSGILLKMGIYGMLVIVIPFFPAGLKEYGYIFIGLSAFGVIYGALIAMVQYDLRKVLAYSSLSHVGLIGTGLLTYSTVALEGVVLQMFAHGVNIAGLFFIGEIITKQAGTRDLDQMGGLTRSSFALSVLFFVFLLGSIAVPLTNGFPGEFKLLMGIFEYNLYLAIFCGLTVILSSVYMLRLFQKAMLGSESGNYLDGLKGLGSYRTVGLSLLAILVLFFGLFPGSISGMTESAVRTLLFAY